MATDITPKRAQEIRDISSSYKKKKQEAIERGERRLKETQDYYRKRETELRKHGSAAINHIKKQNKESIQNVTQRGESQVEAHQERVKKIYEGLSREMETHQNKVNDQYRQNQRTLERQRREQNIKLEENQELYKGQMQSNQKKYNEQLTKIQIQGTKQVADRQRTNREKLVEMQTLHDNQVDKTKIRQEDYYQKIKSGHQQRMDKARKEHQLQVDEFNDEKLRSLNFMQRKYKSEQSRQKENHDILLAKQEKDNKDKLRSQVELQTTKQSKLRQDYDKEIRRVHREGSDRVQFSKEKFDKIERKQEVHHKREMEQKEIVHQERLKEVDKNFEQRKDFVAEEQQRVIHEMRKEHRSRYNTEQKRNEIELRTQAGEYQKAIVRQKNEMMDELTKYDGKEQDPFYKTKFFENTLLNRQDSYYFEVEIPEHERENIDVRVQKNSITIGGIRQHKEDFEAGGQKFKTNSSESFYQEIPLEDSVKTKEVKTWMDGGKFKLIVPKV